MATAYRCILFIKQLILQLTPVPVHCSPLLSVAALLPGPQEPLTLHCPSLQTCIVKTRSPIHSCPSVLRDPPRVGTLSQAPASQLLPTACSVLGGISPDGGCVGGDIVDSDRGEGQYHTAAGPGGGQSHLVPATQPWEQPHHLGHHSCTGHPQLCQAGN